LYTVVSNLDILAALAEPL